MAKQAKAKQTTVRRPGRTFQERFLECLTRMSGGGKIAVRNAALRDELGWLEQRYTQTKELLRKQGLIKAERGGPGGTISLVHDARAKPKALQAFISYSHIDDSIKADLLKHLTPLNRLGIVETWHDGRIKSGEKWADAIKSNLDTADIIVLLVSVDFINSDYCNEIELKRAMERDVSGSAVVIPVIARNCLWQDEVFGSVKATPTDGKSITSFTDRDDALTEVAKAIKDKALSMLAARDQLAVP
ncbi:toll/interleukin-1 receptor domain-containing protein [Mesorhizobium sp. CA13]|uniref:TIR domain-containing protein n=1 Tax=Mesorhizobium sp. CA13 TaxID=2876643 RepID=UPI001CCC8747|nr:toll/interleukin-1 receptor domain-containing protein [Mesorhizobium sp. CA13]MBZ9853798.1 toll/interleukin-1 receptor domain-containing protein [Mesorhizobium sp. CA13]